MKAILKNLIVILLVVFNASAFADCKKSISIKTMKHELSAQKFSGDIHGGKFKYFGCLSLKDGDLMLFTHEPKDDVERLTRRLILMKERTYIGSYAMGTSIPISLSDSAVIFSVDYKEYGHRIDFANGIPQKGVLDGDLFELFK